jgi:putative ABC transport system permease protein
MGQPELLPNERPSTFVRVATPGYFHTLGIPLLRGREFTGQDEIEGSPPVFVVNEAFAKKFFSAEDPLLAAISVNMQPENPYGRIVGIAGDVKDGSLRGTAEPTVYYNNRHLPSPGMTMFIRTGGGARPAREATEVVRQMDRNLPVTEVRMLETAFAQSVARERLNAVVSTAFAVCALFLASLGLYGLLAFVVAERTKEIGIRMALGAHPFEVLRMIMRQGFRLIAVGAAAGLAIAMTLSQFLESLLFGVTAHDPITFAGVATLLVIVCLCATVIPARRATQVDPLSALRKE